MNNILDGHADKGKPPSSKHSLRREIRCDYVYAWASVPTGSFFFVALFSWSDSQILLPPFLPGVFFPSQEEECWAVFGQHIEKEHATTTTTTTTKDRRHAIYIAKIGDYFWKYLQ